MDYALMAALLGLAGGLVLGLSARLGEFCTFGAIESAYMGHDQRRIRLWGTGTFLRRRSKGNGGCHCSRFDFGDTPDSGRICTRLGAVQQAREAARRSPRERRPRRRRPMPKRKRTRRRPTPRQKRRRSCASKRRRRRKLLRRRRRRGLRRRPRRFTRPRSWSWLV